MKSEKVSKKHKGLLIAFVGVDGSGKSTLSSKIHEWLIENNYRSEKLYLGSGDGKINFFSSTIVLLRSKLKTILKSKKTKKLPDGDNDQVGTYIVSFYKYPLTFINLYMRALSLYAISIDNNKKLIKANKRRSSGAIVIVDRFPQFQQKDINDGPKLEKYSEILNSRLLKRLSSREIRNIQIVDTVRPDIVFRLNVSPEISLMRKSEHTDITYLKNKADSLRKIDFIGSIVYDIDSEKNLEETLSDIRRFLVRHL